MKNKINIAELLKDCPKGMKLDCTMFDNVTLLRVDNSEGIIYPIIVLREDGNSITLTKYGQCSDANSAKCVIFPKGKTTWEGFQRPFRDGDIVTWEDRGSLVAFIYKERKDVAVVKHHFALYTGSLGTVTDGEISLVENEIVFATEEEKQKLFDTIKENGYTWNTETKTLEKLPKFKVGDKIKEKTGIWPRTTTIRSYVKGIGYYTTMNDCVRIDDQDNWELVIEKPIFKVGDKIRDTRNNSEGVIQKLTDEGYECHFEYGNFLISFKEQHYFILVLDKFDITTLEPFESRVLVRDNDHDSWKPSFWGYLRGGEIMYDTVRGVFKQCIPYESNEHLMNTTNDCGEFFKTWQK